MNIACFDMLCSRIETSVGADKLFPYEYTKGIKHVSSRICATHEKSTGGMIAGEIKLAVTLRFLAETSYLNLGLLYSLSYGHMYEVFHKVLRYWIINDDVINIDFYANMTDIEQIKRTSDDFDSGSSNGIFSGCIRALNG